MIAQIIFKCNGCDCAGAVTARNIAVASKILVETGWTIAWGEIGSRHFCPGCSEEKKEKANKEEQQR